MSPTMLAIAALGGCKDQTDDDLAVYDGPGSQAWASEDISCGGDEDCLSNEACIDHVCQVPRCEGGPYQTEPPIGSSLTFLQESEIGVADTVSYEGSYWIDGYGPRSSSTSYDGSYQASSTAILDVAGGNVFGTRPETYVVAAQGRSSLGAALGSSVDWLSVGFEPVAVGVGDVDGDGVDEAVGAGGDDFAVCDFVKGSCESWSFSDSSMDILDLTVGDVDGDMYEEIALLMEYGGYNYLYVVNYDAEWTGQVEVFSSYGTDVSRITAADIDGDRVADLVGLVDSGYYGMWDDALQVFALGEADGEGVIELLVEVETDGYGDLLDLEAGDSDADEVSELFVIGEDGQLTAWEWTGSTLRLSWADSFDTSSAPDRIAMADHDGDAPTAELVGGPELCEGDPVPVAVLVNPPYDREHSDGVSSMMLGDSESVSEDYTDTISLGLNVDVGVGASFMDAFGAEMSEKVSWRVSHSTTTDRSISVGSRYSMSADPELYGPHYGGVVLSWGCFNGYTYRVSDPSNVMGVHADGEQIAMVVPVDGSSSIWSTQRYNAMAEALGTLPVIDIPYTVGDASSYPSEPLDFEGRPVADADMLFPEPQPTTVSDVGQVGWWISVSESETNSVAMSTDVSLSASIKVSGIRVGGGASIGWGSAYSVTIGEASMFAGTLPAIPDAPDTPEDEYELYRYAATPYVYLQHYADQDGNDAAYYVSTATAEF